MKPGELVTKYLPRPEEMGMDVYGLHGLQPAVARKNAGKAKVPNNTEPKVNPNE